MNNAELIVQALERAGVRWAFGIPSGPVLPLIEALRTSSIQYVLTASETSAGFMASAVGALTGTPGVCVSTLGPGATNLATGVGAAWLDRAPAIAITCNVDTAWLDRRIQMRIDHHALFGGLTKATLPLRKDNVGESMAQAVALALAEPPGPVHLDLPEDVALADAAAPLSEPPGYHPLPPLDDATLAQVQQALAASKRPLFIGGLSLTRAAHPERLLGFVEGQGMAFISTLHGKGLLPESHSNYAGVLGRARRSDVAALVRTADLIVAVGYDPIEINYEEWAGDTPIVHLSTEAAETDPRLHFAVNAACDLDSAVEGLAGLSPQRHQWSAAELAAHRKRLNANLRPDSERFTPWEALDLLRAKLPADGILSYDVGAHTHQIASQWRTDLPGTLLATNGWSSMGFGIPATYAAKLAHPERAVVGVIGDGCFQMTAGELAAGRRLGLAAPIVVLNDGWLSLLRVKQGHRHFGESGVTLGEPVESPPHYFGVPCRPARTAAEFTAALDWAFAQDGPTVVEAYVDPDTYMKTVYD